MKPVTQAFVSSQRQSVVINQTSSMTCSREIICSSGVLLDVGLYLESTPTLLTSKMLSCTFFRSQGMVVSSVEMEAK
jgi:hypothetical protein